MAFRLLKKTLAEAPQNAIGSDTRRVVTPARRNLPGSRAIVGALLVVIGTVGTFAAASGATSRQTVGVLVAVRDLPIGTRLQNGDLRLTNVEIEASVAGHVVHDPKAAVGRVLLGPLRSGEILQNGSIASVSASTARPEVAFELPAARAVGGDLRSGETVDVLVTDKNAGANATQTAVHNARVVRQDRPGGGIGGSGDVTVVLSVENSEQARDVAAAIDLGQVTLIRTTGMQG